jgi:hypothetical protein
MPAIEAFEMSQKLLKNVKGDSIEVLNAVKA